MSDKTGVVEFARGLRELGWQVIATGGTMKLLAESGVEVINISDVTGFPEICDGRVKTLHPKVHGGLLARRDDPNHLKALRENGIEFIDMVCVNLYPFRQTIAREGVTMDEAIENIDIGGPHFYVDSFEDKEYCILDIPHNRIVVSERFPSF